MTDRKRGHPVKSGKSPIVRDEIEFLSVESSLISETPADEPVVKKAKTVAAPARVTVEQV